MPDELGDHLGAHRGVDQHLEVAFRHLLPFRGVERNDTFRMRRVEVVRHLVEPVRCLGARTCGCLETDRFTVASGDPKGLSRRDIDAGVDLRGKGPAGNGHLGVAAGNEKHDIAFAKCDDRRLARFNLEIKLGLVDGSMPGTDDRAVPECPLHGHFRLVDGKDVAASVQDGPSVSASGHFGNGAVRLAQGIVHRTGTADVVVRAVAEGRCRRVLASAKEDFLPLGHRLVANRSELGPLVPSVAKGLGTASAAAAPEIIPPFLEFRVVGPVPRDHGSVLVLVHGALFLALRQMETFAYFGSLQASR